MFSRPHDGLVLKLLWLALRNGLRGMGLYDRLFLVAGATICLLWPLSDLYDLLHVYAVHLCTTHWIWVIAPVIFAAFGSAFGVYGVGLALSQAELPYLQVQPISEGARRRMAVVASAACSLCTAPASAVILATICEIIHKPNAMAWGIAAASAYLVGAGLGLTGRLWMRGEVADDGRVLESRQLRLAFLPGIWRIDRLRPAWLSSWAVGLIAGRLPVSAGRAVGFLMILLLVAVASAASLARHQAGPAVAGAMLSGLAAFMLVVRARGLDSPVLRTAPIGFMQAWLGMLRLPLLLSAVLFALPASAALAAEPSSWVMPVTGSLGVLILDGVYAIFAAFFLTSPLVAAASFITIVLYASYKWVTYHAVVYFCFAGLLVLMGVGIRRRFQNGS